MTSRSPRTNRHQPSADYTSPDLLGGKLAAATVLPSRALGLADGLRLGTGARSLQQEDCVDTRLGQALNTDPHILRTRRMGDLVACRG